MAAKPTSKVPGARTPLAAKPESILIGGGAKEEAPTPPPAKKADKPFTARAQETVLDESRAAVMATMGRPGGYKTFAAFVSAALNRELEYARQEFNDGKPFEKTGEGFRTGRPLS